MKILSLFDGISCARVALERAGIKVETYTAIEIDKYAVQISKKNYPDIYRWDDVKTYKGCDGIYDLLIGGFPCTDLSIAKKNREGLDGKRSGLFYEMIRIHKEVRPTWFIYENVASMAKDQKELILKTLQEIDSTTYVININAALVSAQQRKRLFFTNIQNITQPEDRGILLRDILEPKVDESFIVKPKSNTVRSSGRGNGIDDKHNWDTIRIGSINKGGQGDRIYDPKGKSVALSANGGGRGAKTGLYAIVPEATKKGYAIATDGQSIDLSFPTSKTRRGRVGDKAKNLMTSQNIGVFTNLIIRKLTPVECERLQGLPDRFSEGVSNSQRYKMLGNAFNVDVITHILSFIK